MIDLSSRWCPPFAPAQSCCLVARSPSRGCRESLNAQGTPGSIGAGKEEARRKQLWASGFRTASGRKQPTRVLHSTSSGSLQRRRRSPRTSSAIRLSCCSDGGSAVGAAASSMSVGVAGGGRATAAIVAVMPESVRFTEGPRGDTAPPRRARRHIGGLRNAVGWDWRRKGNESWMMGVQQSRAASLRWQHRPDRRTAIQVAAPQRPR